MGSSKDPGGSGTLLLHLGLSQSLYPNGGDEIPGAGLALRDGCAAELPCMYAHGEAQCRGCCCSCGSEKGKESSSITGQHPISH